MARLEKFSLENFVEENERETTRKTSVDIQLEFFELYSVQEAVEVTLNIKMLKAGLIFAEACSLSVGLHFDQPGRPVILSFQDNIDFTSEFVLATHYDDENISYSQPLSQNQNIRLSQHKLLSQNQPVSQNHFQDLNQLLSQNRPVSQNQSQVMNKLRRNLIGISQETINSEELFKNCEILCLNSSEDEL